MSRRIIVIAFAGYKGSGKDTATNALKPFGFQRIAFADKLKQELEDFYGIPVADADRLKNLSTPVHEDKTYRELCSWHSKKMRAENPLHYSNHVQNFIETSGHSSIVISDLRLDDELDMLDELERNEDYIIRKWWINNPDKQSDGQWTERDISQKCHAILDNNNTIPAFEGKVVNAYKGLLLLPRPYRALTLEQLAA